MKITVLYGGDIAVIPTSVFAELDRASALDLKVLLRLCGSTEFRADYNKLADSAAKEIGCSRAELDASVSFWSAAGIISAEYDADEPKLPDATSKKKTEKADSKPSDKPITPDELPSYTTAEVNDYIEKDKNFAAFVNECQKAFGKMFNPHEVSLIIGVRDYLGFEGEFMILLLDHCRRMNKRSLQYMKKLAFSFYDDGIESTDALQERLETIEAAATVEGQIRKLFGMKSRAFTTKEKRFVSNWLSEYHYTIEVINKAYEMTVDAINEPSFPYANAIIERWHAEGYTDLAAIEASEAEKLPVTGSFDTKDFFEAALKRGMKEDAGK